MPMKSGFKTSEFWITAIVMLLGIGVGAIAVIYGKNIWQWIIGGTGVVVAFLKAHWYDIGRIKQKIQEFFNGEECEEEEKPVPPLPEYSHSWF